jgi:hypothetical protein
MRPDNPEIVHELESDLHRLGDPDPRDELLRVLIRERLQTNASATPQSQSRALPRTLRLRAVAIAAGVATVAVVSYASLSGGAALTGPAPASAATILRDAAAVTVPAGDVEHLVYSIGTSGASGVDASRAGTVDVWMNPSARPAISVQTVDLGGSVKAGSAKVGRFVQLGGDLYGYDMGRNALALPTARNAAPAIVLPNIVYDGAELAQTIGQLAASGSRVTALPSETLGGVGVDVVQADGVLNRPALRLTLYFDARTHVLRGFDAGSSDPSYPTPTWKVRLLSSTTVPASRVPGGTFTLTLAPGFRVLATPTASLPSSCGPGKVGGSRSDVAPSAATMPDQQSTTPVASLISPLAVCQQHDPSITAHQLVALLAQRSNSQLQAAADAGVLSRRDAATARATLESQLASFVAGEPSGLG